MARWTRREWLMGLGALGSGLLSGCLEVDPSSRIWKALSLAELWNRWVLGSERPETLTAKTYPPSAVSAMFRINNLNLPEAYAEGAKDTWQAWRLTVDGLVRRPMTLSLAELRAWPALTETTRLDCVEGWSAIGSWTGVRLEELLDRVGVDPRARYVVCYAADQDDDQVPFYGSLDLEAARHPQTILAYGFNGSVPMPLDHGAPLRLLVPTQLGYKSTKFIHRIALVSQLAGLGGGNGGYWEDQGYEWNAGI